MPIIFGTPSRALANQEDTQRLLAQLAEMNRRTQAQRQSDYTNAISGVGESIGNAFNTATLAKYNERIENERFDRREQAARDRALYPYFRSEAEATQAAESQGISLPELLAKTESAANAIRGRADTALDVERAHALAVQKAKDDLFRKSVEPFVVPPELQQFTQALSPTEQKEFDRILKEDGDLVGEAISGGVYHEDVLGARARKQAELAPYLKKLQVAQQNQIPAATKIRQALSGDPPPGVVMAMNDKGVPVVVYDGTKHALEAQQMQQQTAMLQRYDAAQQQIASDLSIPPDQKAAAFEQWKSQDMRSRWSLGPDGKTYYQHNPKTGLDEPVKIEEQPDDDYFKTIATNAFKMLTTPTGVEKNQFMPADEALRRSTEMVEGLKKAQERLSKGLPAIETAEEVRARSIQHHMGILMDARTNPAKYANDPQLRAELAESQRAITIYKQHGMMP